MPRRSGRYHVRRFDIVGYPDCIARRVARANLFPTKQVISDTPPPVRRFSQGPTPFDYSRRRKGPRRPCTESMSPAIDHGGSCPGMPSGIHQDIMAKKSRTQPKEIPIVGDVEDWEKDVLEALLEVPIGGECVLYIDSEGGSVYGALAVLAMIRHPRDRGDGHRPGRVFVRDAAGLRGVQEADRDAAERLPVPPHALAERTPGQPDRGGQLGAALPADRTRDGRTAHPPHWPPRGTRSASGPTPTATSRGPR